MFYRHEILIDLKIRRWAEKWLILTNNNNFSFRSSKYLFHTNRDVHPMIWELQYKPKCWLLINRSWAKKTLSSPHEPWGSWLSAIHLRHDGNWGALISLPSIFLIRATHAVSYADMPNSPSPMEPNIDLMMRTSFLISFDTETFTPK